MNKDKNNKKINIITIFILSAVVIGLVVFFTTNKFSDEYKEVKLSTITKNLEANNIKQVEVNKENYLIKAELKNGKKIKSVCSDFDYRTISETYIIPLSGKGQLKVTTSENTSFTDVLAVVPSIILVLMLFVILYLYSGKSLIGSNKIESKDTNVTFKDVAGMDEEKKELEEIVDFLKNPDKYKTIGARMPKGVLLIGKPGCGKTHISKAVAGEADVPFFSCSGSDFVEMFVGLGASRVRSLFKKAKKNSPCIIFIDEIDAIGKKRESRLGSNDEKEGTLNQILVEMDGFKDSQGIIVLAATNRPDILDPALMRAGRFDRQIAINLPDVKGRESIFELYCKNKVLADDVNNEILAKRTPGFAPADIENLMNEAAILTVRYNKTKIDMEVVEKAITKIIAGPEKKSRVISEKEKYLTAIHESGHTICSKYLEDVDPVHQVTIIPHGYGAGGFTMTLPQEDKSYATKKQMTEEIINLLGGRAAEELVLDDISTGASNDIQRATTIARDMVTKYGFSKKLGIVNYSDEEDLYLGKELGLNNQNSEVIKTEIDKEVKEILDNSYEKSKSLINEHVVELKEIASQLMSKETLTGDEVNAICAQFKE